MSTVPRVESRRGAQIARYAATGAGAQILFLTVMAIGVAAGLHYGWAMLVGHVAAMSVSFPLQRRFVFGPGGTLAGDASRFVTVWVAGASGGVICTVALIEGAQWHPVVAQGVVIVVFAALVFLAQKRFTFRDWRPHANR